MRPSILHIGGTIYWTLFTRNPDTMVLKDADSTPTVAVRKNGASVGDSVTITKRSATTGIYDCSYNPAAEVEGDVFTLEETATVTGTTTSQATYVSSFNVRAVAVERGTDGANTTAPDNATIALIDAKTTNLPLDPADQSLIIAATDAVMTRLGAPVGASVSADVAAIQTDVTTLLGRITSTLFSGITSLGDWLRRLARKDVGTAGMLAAEAEIDTGGTSTFTGTTDSLEALADASGGGDAEQATLEAVQTTVNGIAASISGASQIEVTSRVAAGGEITAYIGDDFRVRSGTQLEIPVADVGGALYTKYAAIGAANLIFGASRSGKPAGAITGTVASLAQSGSGASQLVILTVEIEECGVGLSPSEDYVYQIEQRQTQGSEVDSLVEIEGTLILKRRVTA